VLSDGRTVKIEGSIRTPEEPPTVPLYEYRCKNCGHQFEKIQSFSAPEEKECPECHGPVERLLSAPAIQFKGSGWYVNDYAGKSKSGGSAKASADGESKSGDSGSDKKPAEKSATSSSDSSSASSAPSSTSTSKSD
jgi:putative FmdB family regulatory protein